MEQIALWHSHAQGRVADGAERGLHGSAGFSASTPDPQKDHTHLRLVVVALLISTVAFCGGFSASQTLTTYRPVFLTEGNLTSGGILTNDSSMDAQEPGTTLHVPEQEIVTEKLQGENFLGEVTEKLPGEVSEKLPGEGTEKSQEVGNDAGETVRTFRTCDEGCSERGVCNEEIGRCDCPDGLVGRTCERYAMPACHLLNGTGPPTDSGGGGWGNGHLNPVTDGNIPCIFASSCACAFQCDEYLLPRDNWCFDVSEIGTSQTNGTLDLERLFRTTQLISEPGESGGVKRPRDNYNHEYASPYQCPLHCSGRGACIKDDDKYGCRCPYQYDGLGCEGKSRWDTLGMECLNNCSGKGECRDGFCKCGRGFFGIDCAIYVDGDRRLRLTPRPPFLWSTTPPLSPLPDSDPNPPPHPPPRVYVYELPSYMNHWQMQQSGVIDYKEGWLFWERLLGSEWRTADPDEAQFFYIPLILRSRGRQYDTLVAALKYIEDTWPKHYHRRNQTDHIILTNGDWGNCEVSGPYGFRSPLLKTLTTISLWSHTKNMHLDSDPDPCFILGQDIAIPPHSDYNSLSSVPSLSLDHNPPLPPPPRTVLVYFKGYNAIDHITTEKYAYSFGVRQEISRVFGGRENETGFRLHETTGTTFWKFPSSVEQMRISEFCMAPTGYGWSQRNIQGVMLGCIPVIIQPNVVQPYEYDLLDWNEFAVFLSFEDIPRIPEILRAIPPEKVKSLREKGEEVWPRFILSSAHHNPLKGFDQKVVDKWAPVFAKKDAVASLMEVLRLRIERGGWGTDGGTKEGKMGRAKGVKLFGQQLE